MAVAGSDDADNVADAGQKAYWDLARNPSRRGHYHCLNLGFRCCGSSVQFLLGFFISSQYWVRMAYQSGGNKVIGSKRGLTRIGRR